ncbi:MAG: ribbon-helix-helix protein, CopG family [Bryobacterales bacterium]|nr:ribbon-helix-helix protein, CopG family [Bryobacterales bacterium]
MASPAAALLTADKKRTTIALPAHLLEQLETLAASQNTSVNALMAQAVEAGMDTLQRKQKAQQAYEQLRSALSELTPDEQLLVDGINMTPCGADPSAE